MFSRLRLLPCLAAGAAAVGLFALPAPVAAAGGPVNFYFAEGYTGTGFQEYLYLFMPNYSGTATIDYYTESGHIGPVSVALTQGQTTRVDVNQAVGPGHSVSVKATLPNPGVVERTMHFTAGNWEGSTDIVGIRQPRVDHYFAEGSTLPVFKEYLTMVNTNTSDVTVDLRYFTSSGAHPVKTLTLPASTRSTVEVFSGDLNDNPSCTVSPQTCGVGPGIPGVSVDVHSWSLPIISERPFYVERYSFGDGEIRGGHVEFGSDAPQIDWSFAEGTTLPGFREYLTLQNPNQGPANVTITYSLDDGTVVTKMLTLNGLTRSTIEVFNGDRTSGPCTPPACGVGRPVGGVSAEVTSDVAIVAERPMYEVHDFGSGAFGGSHVVVGAWQRSTLWGFSNASTVDGEYDFLTIANQQSSTANVTATYYVGNSPVTKTFTVNPHARTTVEIFNGAGRGVGRGYSHFGIVVSADQMILVEKPTYSVIPGQRGATDTAGYPTASFQ